MFGLVLILAGLALANEPTLSLAEAAEKPKCDAGDLEACFRLASAYQFGYGETALDMAKAQGLLEKGCEGFHGASCNDLAVVHATGNGVPRDEAKAATLYDKACDLKHGMACSNLGLFYRDGIGVKKELAKAESLLLKGCALGDAGGCNELALGYVQATSGFPKKPEVAVTLLTKACDVLENGRSCANLGYLYAKGLGGIGKDVNKGFMYVQKGCKLGNAQACTVAPLNGGGCTSGPATVPGRFWMALLLTRR